MTFSLAILHKPDAPRRYLALQSMRIDLNAGDHPYEFRVFSDPRPADVPWNRWQHELHPRIWSWALSTQATHHVFMTDDLHLAPRFWDILEAMVAAKPSAILGLLSNHPAAPRLADHGVSWYRTNAWIVGPAYVVPRVHLERFLPWYQGWIREVDCTQYGDDSSLNEWISRHGPGEAWHPVPTCIEHRGDIESTWIYGGDKFSRERVSWRATRSCRDTGRELIWTSTDRRWDIDVMAQATFWQGTGPMLLVAGCSEDEA